MSKKLNKIKDDLDPKNLQREKKEKNERDTSAYIIRKFKINKDSDE